jgi:hypothetical protein
MPTAAPTTRTDRGLRLAYADPLSGRCGVVVRAGKVFTAYHVRRVVCEFDREVTWAKEDGTAEYRVRLTDGGTATNCTCPGNRFAGKCRHRDATTVLARKGVI